MVYENRKQKLEPTRKFSTCYCTRKTSPRTQPCTRITRRKPDTSKAHKSKGTGDQKRTHFWTKEDPLSWIKTNSKTQEAKFLGYQPFLLVKSFDAAAGIECLHENEAEHDLNEKDLGSR